MNNIKNFILDVDGVLTDGKFHYTIDGKTFKTFGDADSDALNLLKPYLNIEFISGDHRGFDISKKRIDDMGYDITLVSTIDRLSWIENKYNLDETIYMGDGIFDFLVFEKIGYAIAPSNAFYKTKKYADCITNANGSEGAVAEACVYIIEKLLNLDFEKIVRNKIST